MSYSGYDAAPAWGSTEVHEEDIVKDALRKEQLLKYVYHQTTSPSFGPDNILSFVCRDIAAAQDDLRGPYNPGLYKLFIC